MTNTSPTTHGAWFHPRNLFDKTYEIGILLKGVDGVLELLGAILLLAVPASFIRHLTVWITHNELVNDPQDFLARHVQYYGMELAGGHNLFIILFFLTHGVIKVGLVLALLRQKAWAYPAAVVALTLFLAYQIYLLVVRPTVFMVFLTVLDSVIIWLVWREWRQVRARWAHSDADQA